MITYIAFILIFLVYVHMFFPFQSLLASVDYTFNIFIKPLHLEEESQHFNYPYAILC